MASLAHVGPWAPVSPFVNMSGLSLSLSVLCLYVHSSLCIVSTFPAGLQLHSFGPADPAGMLLAAFRRYPSGTPAPHCEMSRFIPFPASANWARHLIPQRSCPRALDGDWLLVSVSSTVFSLSSLLQPQPEPQQEPVLITMATGSPGEVREMDGEFLKV